MTGNKGEWSEIYVFLKLLADGKLYAADENLNAIANAYYPIIKILRQESEAGREYILDGDIKIVNENNKLLLTVPIKTFVQQSKQLFQDLRAATGRSFGLLHIEKFLNSIDVRSLTALTTDKADIKIVVHDLNTGLKPTLGFSIKSLLGQKSTLFNAGAGTNFIYKLTKPKALQFDVGRFNTNTLVQSKISARLTQLENLGFQIRFHKIQSDNLQLNLELIDSRLPEILAYIIRQKYKTGVSNVARLLETVNQDNPLRFDLSKGHPFYEYKLKTFLVDAALGMTPETVWTGTYDATGGIIIVKETGDLVCYHIYNRNEFENYLLNNTKLEQASTSEDENNPGFAVAGRTKPFKYGWVYEENGELFIKLNLQIRFI